MNQVIKILVYEEGTWALFGVKPDIKTLICAGIIWIIGDKTWKWIENRSDNNSIKEESKDGENQEKHLRRQNEERQSWQGWPIYCLWSFFRYAEKKNIDSGKLNDKIPLLKSKFTHNAGIPNFGNTCYLNSTIQVLACVPKFVNLLSKSNSNLFKYLSQIFILVLSNSSKDKFRPLIEALLNELKQNYSTVIFTQFSIMTQNDCKELYNILIDTFFSECNEKNFFLIKKINLFTCAKGHELEKDEQQLFLTIPRNKKLDAEKLIKDIKENEEKLELICQECGEESITKVSTESLDLPEYLVFYVTDTTNQGRVPKIYIRADKKEYDLFGVICYYGGGKSGHYIAFTLNKDRRWIKYNDAYVNEEDPDYDHAYMLFYKQK